MGVAGQPGTCNDHKMSINGASKTAETGRCLGILVLLLFGVTAIKTTFEGNPSKRSQLNSFEDLVDIIPS